MDVNAKLAAIQARLDQYNEAGNADEVPKWVADPGCTIEDIQRILDGKEPSS